MSMRSFAFLAGAFGLGGCLFTGAETEGLPCNGNGECGPGLQCIVRVCCRDASRCGADGGTETDTDTDTAKTDTDPLAGSSDDAVREVCDDADTVCLSEDVLRYCRDDGKLTTLDCRGACGEFVETVGCHHDSMQDQDTCICTFEREPCTSPGASRCDGNGVEVCDEATWQRADCDDLCVEAGYGGADFCSGGICQCGSSCQDDALRCSDPNTNAICFGGTWYPESCTTICRDAGYAESLGCFYYPGNDSSCMCL